MKEMVRFRECHTRGGTHEKQDSNELLKSRLGKPALEFIVSPSVAQVHCLMFVEDQPGSQKSYKW